MSTMVDVSAFSSSTIGEPSKAKTGFQASVSTKYCRGVALSTGKADQPRILMVNRESYIPPGGTTLGSSITSACYPFTFDDGVGVVSLS